jgi:hypothetical protein
MNRIAATIFGLTAMSGALAAQDMGHTTEFKLSTEQIGQIKSAVRTAFQHNAPNVDFGEMRAILYEAKGIVVVCGVTYERRQGSTTQRFPFVGGFEEGKAFEVLELAEDPLTGKSIDMNCARQTIGAF